MEAIGIHSIITFWVVFCAIGFLLLVIWSIRQHRDPILKIACDEPIEKLIPSIAGLTLSAAVEGNSVELFENGAFFDALIDEIGAAQRSVHFETFLWADGVLARRLAAAFAARARAGVTVRILVDATGSRKMGKEVEKQLLEAGCKLRRFREWGIHQVGVMNERDHRKIAVMDGRVAFTGGHCVVDTWLGSAEDGKHNADVSARLRGPIVHCIQAAFSENWVGHTGEMFLGDDVFPKLERAGDIIIHAAYVKPEGSAPAVKILHHAALCCAKKRIWIQNPYFIPEPPAIEALAKAVARGVDVRVLMPSTSGSDNPMVQHAGHRNFEKLLRSGVRLFEYPWTLLHQKIMTIDEVWSCIGSANFDERSFETNDEITLGIQDAGTAHALDAIFERYAARAREIDLSAWCRRGLGHRLIDNTYYLIKEVL